VTDDPYRFLEDATDARTREWSERQGGLVDTARAGWADRAALRSDLAGLFAVGRVGAPCWRGERSFAMRREPDQDHAVLTVTEPSGERRTLVDPVAIDPDGTTTLDVWRPDHAGDLLAYGLSHGGTEWAEIRVLDVTTGAVVDGPIDRTRHPSIAWLPGGAGFFYPRFEPDDELVQRIHLHKLGTDPAGDTEVFGAGLPHATYLSADTSDDGRWLTVTASRGTDARNDVWLADLTAPKLRFRPIVVGADALTWPFFDSQGGAYVVTNLDAPRRRVCRVDPVTGDWHQLVAEDAEAVIGPVEPLAEAGLLVVVRSRHAVSEVTVHELDTGERVRELALPGVGSVDELSARPGGTAVWLTYTDCTTPACVLRADAATGELATVDRPPGAGPAAAIRTRQVVYPSYDGTPVRMFLIEPADGGSGPRPTILYGYGGFAIPMTPAYAPRIQAWVARGGVYAIANLRGGSEEGEAWHRAGMREHKQNVFDDFAAASDWLVASGLTTRDRLGIAGRSNGGLLVGAALTRHPEKYAAAVCVAPLLDMLRYHHFGLGELWTGEYGSPDDPAEAPWLRAYSPYHHVAAGVAYPATLFVVFEGDSRVDPLHARKMCALLQASTAGPGPILIRREAGVGHSTRAVSRDVELAADELAFLASRLR
jgi:prolyl oligopeptidase